MNKSDVLELKRRLKKNECTFTKISGCYVNSDKDQVLTFTETFLNLEDDEFYKYLDIAKKVLSGGLGNNLLELNFPDEDSDLDKKSPQQFLMALRASRLEDASLMNVLYEQIISQYDYPGNYLIIAFHDAYDVMTKTSDKLKLDESEEIYEYIICAVCPVELSKAGLGYLATENRIGARIRDWVVGAPESGFLFPAFTDRSADIHSVLYYTKNPKDPHIEFMENILGCPSIRTSHEKKQSFQQILKNAVPEESENSASILLDIQSEIHDLVLLNEMDETTKEPVVLTQEIIKEVLETADVPAKISNRIERSFEEEFADTTVNAEEVLDTKTIHQCEQHKVEKELKHQVAKLTQELSNRQEEGKILLTVTPDKADLITTEYINGQKCIIIPLDDNDYTSINGETFYTES